MSSVKQSVKLLPKANLSLADCSFLKSPTPMCNVATPRSPFRVPMDLQQSSTPIRPGGNPVRHPAMNDAFCRSPMSIPASFLSICSPDPAHRVPTPPPWVFNPRLNQPKFLWPHGPIASPRTRATLAKGHTNEQVRLTLDKSECFPIGLPMSASVANDSFCCSPVEFRFNDVNNSG